MVIRARCTGCNVSLGFKLPEGRDGTITCKCGVMWCITFDGNVYAAPAERKKYRS